MRFALGLAFLALLLGAFPANAQDPTGRVRALYYEAGRGVLVEAKMLRRPGAVRWADVELDSKQRVLVQVPAGMETATGDLVAVQLASPKTLEGKKVQAPIQVSRVTEVRTRASQLALP
jgi:hypothetical protein